ncbi:MAG: DUF808 domain-containing protein [Thermomonas sp.]|uniref:DUF808 domain-containing protein n=1 Tax=Thermomonas sp. TaxID=1971895 RepID=UPI001EC56B62|nr:DUF808 domain-containing protein [Thermomonas sp.]MBV2208878.1 DUF808 domain-containing protein [Thermomonas sp.]
MASSFFALFDDIASLLDDIASMTKVASGKTAGVLGDDLALNAEQVSGVRAERELPVVWAVAKGSLVNKAILVPAALIIAALEGWLEARGFAIPLILPLLMLGGAYLCFEGAEKLAHKFLHKAEAVEHHDMLAQVVADPSMDLLAFEQEKIKGAIRTDFVLSAEIIVISLGTVAEKAFATQLGVLTAISLVMTVGVYGLVGGIVKLDDLGLHLIRPSAGAFSRSLGRFVLAFAPKLMKALSVIGTAAMFLVGGGILAHGIGPLHHAIEALSAGALSWLWSSLLNGLTGILAGALLVGGLSALSFLRNKRHTPTV